MGESGAGLDEDCLVKVSNESQTTTGVRKRPDGMGESEMSALQILMSWHHSGQALMHHPPVMSSLGPSGAVGMPSRADNMSLIRKDVFSLSAEGSNKRLRDERDFIQQPFVVKRVAMGGEGLSMLDAPPKPPSPSWIRNVVSYDPVVSMAGPGWLGAGKNSATDIRYGGIGGIDATRSIKKEFPCRMEQPLNGFSLMPPPPSSLYLSPSSVATFGLCNGSLGGVSPLYMDQEAAISAAPASGGMRTQISTQALAVADSADAGALPYRDFGSTLSRAPLPSLNTLFEQHRKSVLQQQPQPKQQQQSFPDVGNLTGVEEMLTRLRRA